MNEALQQLRNELTKLQQQTQDNTDDIKRLARELADRPDRQFIERLFEKFKSSLNGVVDMMENKDKGNGQYATMDDIKKLETVEMLERRAEKFFDIPRLSISFRTSDGVTFKPQNPYDEMPKTEEFVVICTS